MNNSLLQIKIQERVNKLASSDYGNLEPWQMAEAANKAQYAWVRRQLEGINQTKTGAEGSTRRIDDLQCVLTTWTGSFTDQGDYWQSSSFPDDYMEWCRISAFAQDGCKTCPPIRLQIFEGNEADVDVYIPDTNRTPNYAWATTFSTVMSKTFKIWTLDRFDIVDPLVTYYRSPVHIVFINSEDPYTGIVSLIDVECEFPDGVTELIIDDAAAILAGDLDNYQKSQALSQSAEHNN